jgi:hypothetical protein
LVRAVAVETVRRIAVVTEHSVAGGIALASKFKVDGAIPVGADRGAVSAPSAIDVIHREKLDPSLTTASACRFTAAIDGEHL